MRPQIDIVGSMHLPARHGSNLSSVIGRETDDTLVALGKLGR